MKMNFCVGMGERPDISLIADLARTTEESGFDYMTLLNSPAKSLDVHFMMTIAAQNTRRIKIGSGVVVHTIYHPMTIANVTASINELSGGRAFIGLGVGNPASMGRPSARLQDMREAVTFIRKYMAGEEAEYNGVKMQSHWLKRPVPIYISAHGPKSLQLAGEIADGVIFLCIHPVYVKWQMEQIAKGAERAGRDPSTLDTWARCMVYVAPNKEAARRETSAYPSSYAGLWKVLIRDAPEVEDLRRRLEKAEPGIVEELVRDSRKFSDALNHRFGEQLDAPHTRVVTRRLIDFFHFSGKEEDICEAISQLGELGVKTISMTVYTVIDKKGMIKEVGSKIIPRFQK